MKRNMGFSPDTDRAGRRERGGRFLPVAAWDPAQRAAVAWRFLSPLVLRTQQADRRPRSKRPRFQVYLAFPGKNGNKNGRGHGP